MRGSTSSLFHAARTLLLLLILSQLSTYINPSTATKTLHRKRYSQYIKTSCNATIYRRLCYRSLSIFATRIKTSPRLLADTALCLSLSSARKVSKFVLKVSKKKGLKPREAAAIVDCVELVGDTIDNLQKSVSEMGLTGRKGRNFELLMSDIQTWVSAALTDEDTCMDGFGGRSMNGTAKTIVRRRIVKLSRLTSNALALVNRYALAQAEKRVKD